MIVEYKLEHRSSVLVIKTYQYKFPKVFLFLSSDILETTPTVTLTFISSVLVVLLIVVQ